jgi:aminopeptidase N
VGITLQAYDPGAEVSGLPAPVILESVIAHEAAHQWFYNLVGNDQADEPWLDEALAQYATYTYYVDMYGEANAEGYRVSWDDRWNRVDKIDLPIGLSVKDYSNGKEYGALIYGRGPIVVEDIGAVMGAEPFAAFLKDYVGVHKWEIATADSFKQLAEEHCACDLTEQFEAWVYAR